MLAFDFVELLCGLAPIVIVDLLPGVFVDLLDGTLDIGGVLRIGGGIEKVRTTGQKQHGQARHSCARGHPDGRIR